MTRRIMTFVLLIILVIYLPIPYFSIKSPFRVPAHTTNIHALNKRSETLVDFDWPTKSDYILHM